MQAAIPVKIIQISDTHLFADPKQDLLGVHTEKSLQGVIDLINENQENPDFILLSGDLSQDGSLISYQRLARLFAHFNVPVYCVPGNHDDPVMMSQVYPYENISNQKQIVLDHWQIILLDSHQDNAVHGYLKTQELDFLRSCLSQYPKHHAIALFHHQPIPVGAHWLDNLGLKNTEMLAPILLQYPQLKTILFGHVHQEFFKIMNGIRYYATPSTCIQFACRQDNFGLEKSPPGYRWINLYSDGHLETAVKRVVNYIGDFDPNARGY